jgi:hypothetical protein
MVPAMRWSTRLYSRSRYVVAGALRSDVTVFTDKVQKLFRKPKKYEKKNLDGDEAFLIGLSTLFEQPPSVA